MLNSSLAIILYVHLSYKRFFCLLGCAMSYLHARALKKSNCIFASTNIEVFIVDRSDGPVVERLPNSR